MGEFQIQMRQDVAPNTVANFLNYVESGAYNESIFHRSVPGFVIQGGGYTTTSNTFTSTAQFSTIHANAPIANEAQLSNTLGTVAMALSSTNANSATDEWFINMADNSTILDKGNTVGNPPFTVFGEVISGMSVVDAIAGLPVHNESGGNNASPFGQLPFSSSDQLAVIESMVVSGTFSSSVKEDRQLGGVAAVFSNTGFPTTNPADLTATVDWGDGTTYSSEAGNVTIASDSSGNVTLSVSNHSYTDEGAYTLIATLTDNAGGIASQSTAITVTDADSLSASPAHATLTGTENAVVSGSVATFSDAGYPNNSASDFSASIDWGDGTTTTGTVSGGSGTDLTVSGNHTYTDDGHYTVTSTIAEDSLDTATATAGAAANIAESTFNVTAGPPINATEGTALTGVEVAFFSDRGSPDSASAFAATIDWGDGVKTAGSISGADGTFTVTGNHTYADELSGSCSVTLSEPSANFGFGPVIIPAIVAEADTPQPSPTPVTIGTTEGASFSGPVATFTDSGYPSNSGSDFVGDIIWGDGATSLATVSGGQGSDLTVNGTHTYSDAGVYTLTANIIDSPGNLGVTFATATSTVIVAIIATEGQPFRGSVATFTSPDNGPFSATIDWGDGNSSTGTVSGAPSPYKFTINGTHTYAEDGAYPVSVVIDDTSDTTSATAASAADVSESTFSVTAGPTINATEDSFLSGVQVATFSDPGSADAASAFAATVDWGDGSTTAGTISGSNGTFTVVGHHTYAEEGTFGVAVTATETGVAAAAATATLAAVAADAPLSAAAPLHPSVFEFTPFSGGLALFTDGNRNATASDFMATIDWGDGTTSAGTVTAIGSGTFQVSGSHTYAEYFGLAQHVSIADVGGSTLSLRVVPGDSGEFGSTLLERAIALHGFEPAPLTNVSVATFSHGYGGEPAADFSASIDWGDGFTSAGTITESAGGTYTVSGSHTYFDEGAFPVAVRLNDDDGGFATFTGSATIAEQLLPNGSVGTPNERFVQELYRDLLHRAVDSAGLQYWTGLLDQGQSRGQVVTTFIAASMRGELGAHLVTGIYEKYLGRAPDAGGLAYWVAALQKATIEDIEADIAGTQEFFALSGATDTGFLDRLYRLALDRARDPEGLSGFSADLASGMTRQQVAAIVFSSHEFHQDLVAGFYQSSADADDRQNTGVPFIDDLDFLDRPADAEGLTAFTTALDHGDSDQQIWASILASDEFFAKLA